MLGFDSITAYILAEGFCARLGQAVPDRPNALAEVLGRPYIYHLLDSLAGFGLKRVVICTDHTDGMLEQALGPAYRGMELLFSRDEESLGTGGALRLAMSRHPSDLALCINGDSLTDADFREYLRWFQNRSEAGALLLVPVDDAARYGSVSADDSGRVGGFAEKGQAGTGWISAGVSLLKPECLADIAPGQSASIEHDVFPALAERGLLCAYRASARFLAIGTPESYAVAGRFLLGQQAVREFEPQPAVFLDRDGTIIVERHYLHDPAGVELLPGAAQGMRRMSALGLRLVLVSNQSGVGRGYFGRDAVERVHGRLIELLEAEGVRLDGLYICPHAPAKDSGESCRCRKPLPGLIERASREIGLNPALSFVVGDKPCDVDMGLAVNATTLLVATGYGAGHAATGGCCPHHLVASLDEAADIIESILAARTSGGVEAGARS